jgi:hypothetical protein
MSTVLDRPAARTPDRPRPLPDRRPSRSPAQRRERTVVGLGLLLVGVVHSLNLAGWPRYWDDEGTYFSQAWAVQHLGALAPYTYWYDHPPLGWLQLAGLSWLPDLLLGEDVNSSLLSGRIVMVAYTLATALLTYVLATRLGLSRSWALAAMLLWALNPLVVFEGRQILLDNIALPWVLGAFVLALSRRKHLGLHVASGLCFGVAVLSKETTIVFLPALLLALWQSAYRPTRAFALTGFSVIVTILGSMYLLFALIRSELFPGSENVSLYEALVFQLAGREGSGWLLDPNGPAQGAYASLSGWLDLDSGVLVVGGVVAGLITLAVRRLRPVGVAILVAALVALRPAGYLPQMYVVAVLPFCALAVVGVLHLAWRRVRWMPALWARVVTGAALVVGVAAVLAALPLHDWQYNYRAALTDDTNDIHAETVDYVADALPRDATVVVDNALWNDLVDRGWDSEDVLWFYKVDSDGEVVEQVGGTRHGIDYLVWTPDLGRNAGPIVDDAYENSTLLWETGTGQDRVEVRRVLSRADEAQLRAEQELEVAARLVAENENLAAHMAGPSPLFPELTNGQVSGMVAERGELTVDQLAERYAVPESTVAAVLSVAEQAARDLGTPGGR